MKSKPTKYDKLDYLLQNCSSTFIKECTFLNVLVGLLSEEEFTRLHDNIIMDWNIKTPYVDSIIEAFEVTECL